jgi:glycosyltransferase involved in cell wall biosynthesis
MEEVATRLAEDPAYAVTVFGSGRARDGQAYRYRRMAGVRREWFEKFPKLPYVRDAYMWEELAHAPALFWRYRPRDFDVTVTCGYPYSNVLLRRGRKGRRPKHVFITQNGDWMVQAKNAEYKYFGCDGLICTNPEYFDRHKNNYPCALIPNGVDTRRFYPASGRLPPPVSHTPMGPGISPGWFLSHRDRQQFDLPEHAPVFLIVSALIASKRVADGIRAAADVTGAFLVVAGDGDRRVEVDALGAELMPGRFRRITLPRERMPDLYRAADVLLHMSKDEPFGNIYIEALATGLPVVAHDTPVTRWILGEHATLLDTGDLVGVARALEQALARRSVAEIEARRAAAETRFGWPAIARQYGEFCREIFARGD